MGMAMGRSRTSDTAPIPSASSLGIPQLGPGSEVEGMDIWDSFRAHTALTSCGDQTDPDNYSEMLQWIFFAVSVLSVAASDQSEVDLDFPI